jgi:myo-inositol 2-dehydrogenase/D-chiro-inositol 1-dehydrogenase
MNKRPSQIKRRDLLKAAAVAAPMIVSSRVFGKDAPSNTLSMASIGTGRMGHGDMKECLTQGYEANARIVAVCDLDSNRAEHAKAEVETRYTEKFGKGAYKGIDVYGDFREVLARDDIDGVTISTPEHWHALVGIAAANAGKDMYVQKPITYSVVEGRKLVEAVRRNKVILQTGSQQRSSVYFRKTCELVRNGRIGKLHTMEVSLPTDKGTGEDVPMDVPKNLNYEMWLGPTRDEKYTEHRVHPREGYSRPGWLQIEQYCRGMITGWGAHMYDIAQWGNGTDVDSGPIELEAEAEFPDRGLFNVHTEYSSTAMYANGVKMVSRSGSPAGVKFIGDKGWIFVQRGSFKSEPESILREEIGENEIHLYESKNHMLNFLESMRSRKEPCAPVEVGHRSNTVCVLTHIAMKLGRKLKWDPEKERFKNDKEANSMLDYPHREPWTV